ncbi:MAG: hypothetical protein ACE5HV_08070 [Acidobacteriota bacterium]
MIRSAVVSCFGLLLLAAPQAPSQDVEALRAHHVGTLEGRVRLSGDVWPQPTQVENTTDPKVCGHGQTLEDLLVSSADRGIENVIVVVEGVPTAKVPPHEAERLVLDNRACRFVPHVSVLTVGSEIVAINNDPMLHTEHFYGAVNANVALPLEKTTVTKSADRAGMIIVKCDVHGWMQAFIRVDDHPFHAVTDENGRFRISGIPVGSYRLELWHEKLGRQQRTVRIKRGETEIIQIEYRLDSR